ncbi:MAG: UDP-glucose/GDP-mannose dehydrogenase family protein, partial [Actinobacteria bacterium]|nr:UDP-glucose/GDP-mannose dehydrogenase family protein [Actinomycetota bacterium]
MRVGIVGVGHVGLPTAAALAHIGHDVVAMDSDSEKIESLDAGEMPFYEEGMDVLVAEGISTGRLKFTTEIAELVSDAEVVFICVGTPPRSSGEANLLAVEQAAEAVASMATSDLVLVGKSTVPAGTGDRLLRALEHYKVAAKLSVVSNPEFLREGRAIHDSLHPSRILVGSDSPHALATMRRLYEPLLEGGAEWIQTDIRTAELAKHASNAFLSLKISFANAMARVCELAGADVTLVADAMGADPRIGRAFLNAGLGYGGYCFPKDLTAFHRLAGSLGYDFRLLEEVAQINDEAVSSVFKKIEEIMWNLEQKKIALLGLSFKPGTDDTRLSPALVLAEKLIAAGANVVGYDPQANENARRDLPSLKIADTVGEALEGAHCMVIATEWPEFRSLNLAGAAAVMTFSTIVDARNLLDPEAAVAAGFSYFP